TTPSPPSPFPPSPSPPPLSTHKSLHVSHSSKYIFNVKYPSSPIGMGIPPPPPPPPNPPPSSSLGIESPFSRRSFLLSFLVANTDGPDRSGIEVNRVLFSAGSSPPLVGIIE
ncbi:hypothetical protein PENTCL1PPCAC_27039, partial [Pristionchus entomophagus]